ncbi:MAG: competence/damage-inducible protein A [Candidatus Latescibacteria bacterium]|nr:competence/damage-inducible protein A [Candidatus Latescibacterota bacterium]
MITAEIITIGDEILYGSIVDSNAAYMGQCLTEMGIQPAWSTTVGDDREHIRQALDMGISRADVILVTGGLGPTHDDITKDVIADVIDRRLIFHQELLDVVERMFAARGILMPESNRVQAFIPDGATILDNPIGTAPGFAVTSGRATIFVMPGVPREMKKMMVEQVTPRLQDRSGGHVILHRMIKTSGIGESSLSEYVGEIIAGATNVKVASLPQATGVMLRLTTSAPNVEQAREQIGTLESEIYSRAGAFIYGTDDDTMEQVVGQLLAQRNETIAVAESCTGGLISDRLTDVSGSSSYFQQGIITYSNEAKIAHLGVPAQTIEQHGAVSAETAEAMAEGIRRVGKSTYGLSTTGVAGPTGGSDAKPVGLVYVGLAHETGVFVREFRFSTDRRANKTRSMLAALNMVRLLITNPKHL